MKTFVILFVFGSLLYLMVRRGFAKQLNEVDESIALQKDGAARGFIANLTNIIRNPPVAQTGMRSLFTANVNPFLGTGAVLTGSERETQTLPKFVGVDSGSTLSTDDSNALVSTNAELFYVPPAWLYQ